MTIGACLIVKNEKDLLPLCLESVKGLDAIFIADTGSTDDTVEVAKKYTPNVYTEYKWEDSFCKARNFVKSKCTTDWILSIDADEVLHDIGSVREAVALAEAEKAQAVDITMVASDNSTSFKYPRLFKNVPEAIWYGNIHNHLSILGAKLGNVKITHSYSPAHQLDPERTMRILEKDVKENGGPREMFYLGREYFYRGQYDKCVVTLGKYVQLSKFLSEKAEAFLTMSKAYWQLRMADDARDAVVQALIINANFKEAILHMAEMSWPNNAEQWKRMADTANNEGVLFVRNL